MSVGIHPTGGLWFLSAGMSGGYLPELLRLSEIQRVSRFSESSQMRIVGPNANFRPIPDESNVGVAFPRQREGGIHGSSGFCGAFG